MTIDLPEADRIEEFEPLKKYSRLSTRRFSLQNAWFAAALSTLRRTNAMDFQLGMI